MDAKTVVKKPHGAKKSQKGRKIGRNKAKPCQKRYVSEHRSERNAARRAARHKRRVANFAARLDNGLAFGRKRCDCGRKCNRTRGGRHAST
jgi:hypothetical protein